MGRSRGSDSERLSVRVDGDIKSQTYVGVLAALWMETWKRKVDVRKTEEKAEAWSCDLFSLSVDYLFNLSVDYLGTQSLLFVSRLFSRRNILPLVSVSHLSGSLSFDAPPQSNSAGIRCQGPSENHTDPQMCANHHQSNWDGGSQWSVDDGNTLNAFCSTKAQRATTRAELLKGEKMKPMFECWRQCEIEKGNEGLIEGALSRALNWNAIAE